MKKLEGLFGLKLGEVFDETKFEVTKKEFLHALFGKAPAFDAGIRRFESYRPSQFLSILLTKLAFGCT